MFLAQIQNAPYLESFRELRINLQFLGTYKNQNSTIGITSSISNEGKTFSAVNLGAVIAQSGKRVIILDADLRNSSMESLFDISEVKQGFSSYLIGSSKLEDIIHKSQINNLDVIFAGAIPPNPSDLLGLPTTEVLIKNLKDKYDYIIIDTPPIGLVGDYIILSRFIDTSIYISRYNLTRKTDFEKINNLYSENKIKNISIVLNGVALDLTYGSNPYYTNKS